MGLMTVPAGEREVTLKAAVGKAASFLSGSLRAGAYGLACIGSDGKRRFSDNKGHVFVASFIAEAMAGVLDEIDRTIILMRIFSEENEGQWGFSPPGLRHSDEFRVFHVDADDTAYVIRTLQWLGVNRTPQCLMRFYRERERLFVTFDAPGQTSLTAESRPEHNLLAHPEVNLNVFLALRGTHLEGFINYDMVRLAQDKGGFWRSYFYPSQLLATLLALDLVSSDPAFTIETQRALSSIVESQNSDGSWGFGGDSYETALAVAALAGRGHYGNSVARGVDYLLASMAEDGSWTSRTCVWEFPAEKSDVWRAYDPQGAFVTARCCTALRRVAGQLTTHTSNGWRR